IGFFFLLLFPIGYGAIALIAKDAQYHDQNGGLVGGPNTVSIHLSHAGCGEPTLAVVFAVAFATIISVFASLNRDGPSNIPHGILRTTGPASEVDSRRGVRGTRIAALVLGAAATLLALAFREQNVAYMLGLSFALAASANFPILLLSLYWPKLTAAG